MSDGNLPCLRIPDPDTSVKTASRHPVAIKGDCIDLAVMPRKRVKAATFGNTPHLGGGIITARHHDVTLDLQTPDAGLVADKQLDQCAVSDIPNPKGRVSGSGNGRVGI